MIMKLSVPFMPLFSDLRPLPQLMDMGWSVQNVGIPPQGGRVRFFLQNWQILTNDSFVLDVVSGFNVEFLKTPTQRRPPHTPRFCQAEMDALNQEVNRLVSLEVLHQVTMKDVLFLSHPFLRLKKEGSFRMILNLKPLNAFIPYEHFKMETLQSLKCLVKENDFMIKIDLKDAYLQIPLSPQTSRYVAFKWNDHTYKMTSMPFGLACAPRVFTKVTKLLVALLRSFGLRLVIYLDDMLILNQNKEALLTDRDTVLFLLMVLGFVVNWRKSILIPTQTIDYLGFSVNSINMTLSLPRDRLVKISSKCTEILTSQRLKVRNLSELIGQLTATGEAVLPGPLHYRQLQKLKAYALSLNKQSYEGPAILNEEARSEIKWWVQNLETHNGRGFLNPEPDLILETDASLEGWGARANQQKVQGLWSTHEKTLHINVLELKAAHLALRALTRDTQVRHVHIMMDNVTAVAHVNRMGGTKSNELIQSTRDLWEYSIQKGITVTAQYLPGIQNQVADTESRVFRDYTHWRLDPKVFQLLTVRLGQVTIDLFADRLNTQMTRYVSWKPDPFALATDAFTIKWTEEVGYIFPPFCLIGRVMAKVQREEATATLVAPVWSSQPWYPLILESVIDYPVLLPPTIDLLTSPTLGVHPLLQTGTLRLAAWRVSGRRSLVQTFLERLPNLSRDPGGKAPGRLMRAHGDNLPAGVKENKLIPFQPLWAL